MKQARWVARTVAVAVALTSLPANAAEERLEGAKPRHKVRAIGELDENAPKETGGTIQFIPTRQAKGQLRAEKRAEHRAARAAKREERALARERRQAQKREARANRPSRSAKAALRTARGRHGHAKSAHAKHPRKLGKKRVPRQRGSKAARRTLG